MKPKNMILLVVAIGCGLVASYMTSRLLAERGNNTGEAKVGIVVAKKKVAAWTIVKDPDAYFAIKEVPESAVPKKALTTLEAVKTKRVAKTLSEDAFIMEDDLVDPKSSGLEMQMAPGERAIAIKVNAETLAGGFIQPGSRVDIVSTLRGNASEAESKIIMQNMLILAVDLQDAKDPERRAMLGQTVTLAAKPEEAQRLSLASQIGELRLILRPPFDKDPVVLKASKVTDLSKPIHDSASSKQEEEPVTAAAPPVPALPALPASKDPAAEKPAEVVKVEEKKQKRHTLEIRTGEFVQKVVFTQDEGEDGWKTASADDAPPPAPRSAAPAPKPAAPPAPKVTPPAPSPAPAPAADKATGRNGPRASR